DGRIKFCKLMALTTSTGVKPLAWRAWVLISTATSRCLPPYGQGMAAPGITVNCGRTKLTEVSKRICSGRLLLLMPTCMMGTLDAEYTMISGGLVPAGSCRTEVCEMAVI